MVVTESLARGLPVIASHVGGLPLALGHAADGSRPGLLVPPDDPGALADALRRWLEDADAARPAAFRGSEPAYDADRVGRHRDARRGRARPLVPVHRTSRRQWRRRRAA